MNQTFRHGQRLIWLHPGEVEFRSICSKCSWPADFMAAEEFGDVSVCCGADSENHMEAFYEGKGSLDAD